MPPQLPTNGLRAHVLLPLLALLLGLVGAERAVGLDHFRIHEVKRVKAAFKVGLIDQFDPALKKAEVRAITHFANPSRKVHGATQVGIEDPNAHFTWYLLRQPQPEPRRTVRFRNQFGQHSVDIRDPRFLLVPAQKTSHAGSSFPKTLDHYKCYQVVRIHAAPPLPLVLLGDQFGSQQNAQVGKPTLFCLPAQKQREHEKPLELFDAKTHLAVYALPPAPKPVRIKARDQFGERALAVTRALMLAVPTEKQAVVAHP
jgi:hypothetical protein